MLRSALHSITGDQYDGDGFRLRGLGFSRLDAFSDVVFGFAVTLLVVSLEVPRDYGELHHLLAGFIPFGISFLMLMLVWFGHYSIFRRLGTHDSGSIWLNGLLLFVVLFYVYPLKFLFLSALDQVGQIGGANMRELVLFFAGGFSIIYLLFAALYANGYRQRVALELTPLEQKLTQNFVVEETGTACIGLVVCVIALFIRNASLACLAFMLIAPWKSYMGFRAGRFGRTMAAEPGQPAPH